MEKEIFTMAGATFRGKTALDTSGMRRGLAQMREDIRKFTKEVNDQTAQSGLFASGGGRRYQVVNVRYRVNLDSIKAAFSSIRKMADTFRASVAAPFRELAANLERTIKRAGLTTAAFSALGVRNVFQYEAIQEQFAVLMKDSDAAKKRVAELAELAKQSPFSLTDYTQAAKTLYAVGNEALGTNKMIQMVGDSAAAMGVNMLQGSIWVARLYNSLKSGSGVGTTGDDMMRAGMLTAENYAKLVNGSRKGVPFAELWDIALKDLSRFEGGMDRLAKTGTGNFMKLRDNIHLASIDMFSGMADSMKDVLYNIDLKMTEMFQNGTFRKWGEKIGEVTGNVVNYIGRIIETWKRLSDSSKATLKKILLYGGALVLGLRSGLIQPLISLAGGLVKTAFSGIDVIGKSVIAGSGLIMSAVKPLFSFAIEGFKGIGIIAKNVFSSVISSATPAFKTIFSKLTMLKALPAILATGVGGWTIGRIIGEMLNPAKFAEKINAIKSNMNDAMKMMQRATRGDERERHYRRYIQYTTEYQEMMRLANEVKLNPWKAAQSVLKRELIEPLYNMTNSLFNSATKKVKAKGETVLNNLAAKLKERLTSLSKNGLGSLWESFAKTFEEIRKIWNETEGFQILKAPKLPSIRKQLQTKEALNDVRKIYAYTLRGIYAGWRGVSPFRRKEGGARLTRFKSFASRTNVRRLDDQLERNRIPDRRRFAGRSTEKFREVPQTVGVPRGVERIVAGAAGATGAASAAGILPNGIPFFGMSIPGLISKRGLFNKSHDPGAMVTGAMTPKPSMQTDRTKEIAASFGIANGYLRDIRDRIKTFDGAAVYG